jgi:hypothetical protein
LFEELHGPVLRVRQGHRADQYSPGKSRFAVLAGIPLVHGIHDFGRLANCQDRPFGYLIQLLVGNDGCNLDDVIRRRIETGHFEIDPDQIR